RLAHPHENGTDGVGATDLGQQLVSDVGGIEIWADQHVSATLERAERIQFLQHFRGDGNVGHYLAIYHEGRVRLVQEIHSFANFLAKRVFGAPEAGKREHRDPRYDVETPSRFGGAEGNFRQIFRRGIDVHGGVSHEVNVTIACDHDIAPRNRVQPFAHADDLQRRADGIGVVLHDAGDERIGIPHAHHHGSKNVAVIDPPVGFAQRYTPTLPQPAEFLNVGFAERRLWWINDAHVLQIQPQIE